MQDKTTSSEEIDEKFSNTPTIFGLYKHFMPDEHNRLKLKGIRSRPLSSASHKRK